MKMQKIFFSYSRTDGSEFALRLALDLKKKGFDAWIDQEDIRAGSEWDLQIEKALQTCDCLLFIETEKSVISNNVLDEVYYALEQGKKVIPAIFVDSKTPFRLQRLQHIDFTKDYKSGLSLLINELEQINFNEAVPEAGKPAIEVDKPFYARYSRFLLLTASLVIILAASLIYTAQNNNAITPEKNKQVGLNGTAPDDRTSTDNEPNDTLKNNNNAEREGMNENRVNTNSKKGNKILSTAANEADLNETFTGTWELVDVNPKARLTNGYLKIESIDEKRVTIKSHLQLFYFKTNDTSYLAIFNAFAGCASCILENDFKITAEYVAIGSQFIKILKADQADGRKTGDTIMDAGSNQSIRASVSLHLVDSGTVAIKVRQPVEITLAHGLILKPFVYTFHFKKSE